MKKFDTGELGEACDRRQSANTSHPRLHFKLPQSGLSRAAGLYLDRLILVYFFQFGYEHKLTDAQAVQLSFPFD